MSILPKQRLSVFQVWPFPQGIESPKCVPGGSSGIRSTSPPRKSCGTGRRRFAGSADPASLADAVAYLSSQSPRAMTHELQVTPALDRWVP